MGEFPQHTNWVTLPQTAPQDPLCGHARGWRRAIVLCLRVVQDSSATRRQHRYAVTPRVQPSEQHRIGRVQRGLKAIFVPTFRGLQGLFCAYKGMSMLQLDNHAGPDQLLGLMGLKPRCCLIAVYMYGVGLQPELWNPPTSQGPRAWAHHN